MSILVNTCPTCGAEESIDSVIFRVIDDEEVRGLVNDVLQRSFALGGTLIRYVRLFKPPKHQLNWVRVRKALAELVPDIQRGSIERNGAVITVSTDLWLAAFSATFDATSKGTLRLPLAHNGYVYGALVNLAEKAAAKAEEQREVNRRSSRRDTVTVNGEAMPIGQALGVVFDSVDPAVAKIDAASRNAAPVPQEILDLRAKLGGKGGAT